MPQLDVKYFSQNDNLYWEDDRSSASPGVQCCPTANATLLYHQCPEFRKISDTSDDEPECLYKASFLRNGWSVADRGNHDAHTGTLSSWGLNTQWRTDLTDADVRASIDAGFPVVCGFEYKVSGHICTIVGWNDAGYIVHDPYGIRDGWNDRYIYLSEERGDTVGAFDRYSWRTLEQVFFSRDGQRRGGWGRVRV